MKQLFRTIALLALPLAVACNTDYNFDNISLEVTVGDTEGISIPVGSTDKITVSSLLGDTLKPAEDGSYGFIFSDQMSHTVEIGTIDPIVGIAPDIEPISATLVGDLRSDAASFSATTELSFPAGIEGDMTIPEGFPLLGTDFSMHYDPHTFEGSFELELPEQVAQIKKLTFGPNGEGSLIDLRFDLGGMAGVSDKRLVEKFNIELPAGFTLAVVEGQAVSNFATVYAGEGSSTPNHFHIEQYQMEGNELVVDILVKSADLSTLEVGKDGKLTINESVTFDLDFTGSFKAGTVSAVAPKVSINANLEVYEASIVAGNASFAVEQMERFTQSVTIPEEVAAIHSIEILDNATGERGEIELKLKIENSPVDVIELRDVEITLPPYLELEFDTAGWDYQNGKLTSPLQRIICDGTNNILGRFTLARIGQLTIDGGKVDLSSNIGLKATAAIPEGKEITIGFSHKDVVITPEINIPDLKVGTITGVIDPDFGSLIEPIEVDLSEFTSQLEGLELDLNIASPLLNIVVENPIGVGIDAAITIDAYKDNEVVTSLTTPTVAILPAATTSIYVVSEASAIPEGATGYVVEGLEEMISTLPDKLLMTLNATTNKDKPHTITLQESYTFNVAYAVDAPIAFSNNSDGHISYTTTIDDIDLTELADIEVVVESLVLNITSESTLPIELSLALELLDAAGEVIPTITATATDKIAGTASNEPKLSTSSVNLTIAAPEGTSPFAEVAKINKVRCTLEGTTLAGGALKADQYIDLSFSLLLDKGITVDLESFLPTEEPEAAE